MPERVFSIPETHPSLEGHFPGNPVVPGVVLLAYIWKAMGEETPAPAGLGQVKFLRPVRPGTRLVVSWSPAETKTGRLSFRCLADGQEVVTGDFRLRKADT